MLLQRLAHRLRHAAGSCGCWPATTEDVYVPSLFRGGVSSSSQTPIGDDQEDEEEDEDEDEDKDVDHKQEELGLSQLQDAPSTQPTQQLGTRQCRPPDPFTLGTSALGHKGKGKTRRH